MATKTKRIDLNPPERLFRQCLLDCRNEMRDVPGMALLELRWTGGWVRDKLLGIDSKDIDVALSTMTGEQFGEALKQYMQKYGRRYEEEADAGGFKAELKNLHKIAANPEKSKHLETITTRMFGIDVDFVNLRKETYTADSRNPQMEFGTAEEDALRRDATINALFYNLDEQRVEDFTQRGLDDMQNKIIRTPLEPYQTFEDDPLRILRLIRFASRLGFDIDPASMNCMRDTTIHNSLRLKISRERVGVEIGKIVSGPDPHRGLMLIQELDLYHPVFANPASMEYPDVTSQPKVYDGLSRILEEKSAICMGLKPKEDIGTTWTLAAYVPWKASDLDAVQAARMGIRATNTFSKTLNDAVKNRKRLRGLVEDTYKGKRSRGAAGMILRNAGLTWPSQMLYSLLCDLASEQYEAVVERYTIFLQWLDGEKMMGAASLRPILNGNEIKEALNVKHAGIWLKDAIDRVVTWQYEKPNGTAEEARAYIRSQKSQLN